MEKGGNIKTVKTVIGYAAHARLLSEVEDAGWVRQLPIHTPYRYSPTNCVYLYRGAPVVIAETAHRRYEAIAVPAGYAIRATEAEALADFVAARKEVGA